MLWCTVGAQGSCAAPRDVTAAPCSFGLLPLLLTPPPLPPAPPRQAVVELQRRCPNARLMYVSATGATELDNLCYMTRLGLWGQGTAFTTKHDFVKNLEAGGVGGCLG